MTSLAISMNKHLFWHLMLLSAIIFGSITTVRAVPQPDQDLESILFLGASNSVEEIDSVPRNGSYVSFLRQYGSPWDTINLLDGSVSGYGVADYFGNIELVNDTVFESNVEYVVIVLGGNDFLGMFAPTVFEERFSWLIQAILFLDTTNSLKQIFVANIYWALVTLNEERTRSFEQYLEIIDQTSKDNDYPLLDFFNVTENQEDYYVDNIHLNDLGHQAIAQEVDLVVGPYLSGDKARVSAFDIPPTIFSYDFENDETPFPFVIFLVVFIVLKTFKKISRRRT